MWVLEYTPLVSVTFPFPFPFRSRSVTVPFPFRFRTRSVPFSFSFLSITFRSISHNMRMRRYLLVSQYKDVQHPKTLPSSPSSAGLLQPRGRKVPRQQGQVWRSGRRARQKSSSQRPGERGSLPAAVPAVPLHGPQSVAGWEPHQGVCRGPDPAHGFIFEWGEWEGGRKDRILPNHLTVTRYQVYGYLQT